MISRVDCLVGKRLEVSPNAYRTVQLLSRPKESQNDERPAQVVRMATPNATNYQTAMNSVIVMDPMQLESQKPWFHQRVQTVPESWTGVLKLVLSVVGKILRSLALATTLDAQSVSC